LLEEVEQVRDVVPCGLEVASVLGRRLPVEVADDPVHKHQRRLLVVHGPTEPLGGEAGDAASDWGYEPGRGAAGD
jgi:hypothetical protein